MLLEDLLEQEKREQERQAASVVTNDMGNNVQANNQGLLSDQDFERLRADVLNSSSQGIPQQGMMQMQPQQQPGPGQVTMQQQQPMPNQFVANNRQQQFVRGINQSQWRPPMHNQQMNANMALMPVASGTNEQPMNKKEG